MQPRDHDEDRAERSARFRQLDGKLTRLDAGQIEILRRLNNVEEKQAEISERQAVISAALGVIRWLGPILVAIAGIIAARLPSPPPIPGVTP